MTAGLHDGASRLLALLCGACLLAAGCSQPVSARRVDPRTAYRTQTANTLSSADLSNPTRIVLRRHNMTAEFVQHPEHAIGSLRRKVLSGLCGSDEIFALAETSFARMPADVIQLTVDIASLRGFGADLPGFRLPTSIDNMSPTHRFIRTIQSIPVTPSIPAHSIVACKGTGPVETENDGVVRYESAHIDGVDSELIVHSSHSCQAHPDTIEEVRRILRLHASGLSLSYS